MQTTDRLKYSGQLATTNNSLDQWSWSRRDGNERRSPFSVKGSQILTTLRENNGEHSGQAGKNKRRQIFRQWQCVQCTMSTYPPEWREVVADVEVEEDAEDTDDDRVFRKWWFSESWLFNKDSYSFSSTDVLMLRLIESAKTFIVDGWGRGWLKDVFYITIKHEYSMSSTHES